MAVPVAKFVYQSKSCLFHIAAMGGISLQISNTNNKTIKMEI